MSPEKATKGGIQINLEDIMGNVKGNRHERRKQKAQIKRALRKAMK
jgi:hypothetical protein